MFNTKCLELVKALHDENKKDFKPTKEYNEKLLAYHKYLMDNNSHSRCVCPYNLEDTNENKYIKYNGKSCKHNCSKCIGFLLYDIWCTNGSIKGCFDVLNDKQQGVEFKEACFHHLKNYRKELRELLIKAHNLGL